MKKTFFILPVAITLLFGFVSCNDSKNEEEKQDLKYSVNFSKEECEQKLNEWKAKKPKKYSFTCYCNDSYFSEVSNHYALAKITVSGEESSIKYYKGRFSIDLDDSYILDVYDEEADYKVPEKGDLFYITNIEDVFTKTMNVYNKHKNKIESKSYPITYVYSHYDKNYSFIDDFYFHVSTFDYSELYFDGEKNAKDYISEFLVYITDFKVLEN